MYRAPNPNWWLVGGVAAGTAAALGAGYSYCRPKVISVDQVNLGWYGEEIRPGETRFYRQIRYKGCFQPLPYEVLISTEEPFMGEVSSDAVIIRTSHESLEAAREFSLAGETTESNPVNIPVGYPSPQPGVRLARGVRVANQQPEYACPQGMRAVCFEYEENGQKRCWVQCINKGCDPRNLLQECVTVDPTPIPAGRVPLPSAVAARRPRRKRSRRAALRI